MFLAGVRVPAGITTSLSGDTAMFGEGDSAPEITSSIGLVALGLASAFWAFLVGLYDSEVISFVLLTTVRVPARFTLRLSGNAAVFGFGDSAPEVASSIVLMSVRFFVHIFKYFYLNYT